MKLNAMLPGVRMARPGQAPLPIPMGRELHRRDAARGPGDRRAAEVQQHLGRLAPGGAALRDRLLHGQEAGRASVHGRAVAHDHPRDQPGLQLQAGVLQAPDRVREHDPRETEELQRGPDLRRRFDHGPSALRLAGPVEEPGQRADPRAATLRNIRLAIHDHVQNSISVGLQVPGTSLSKGPGDWDVDGVSDRVSRRGVHYISFSFCLACRLLSYL